VADLTKYPNPLRLFTQTRDEWFTDLVSTFEIPMHIFSAVRDTQLGQLMFAIETVRMKRKRAGEDPGPGLLEGDNATMFIPLFRLINQFQNIITAEELEIDEEKLYGSLLSDELIAQLDEIHKTGQEWFTPLPESRLDELYITINQILTTGVVEPMIELSEFDDVVSLKEKMTEIDEDFVNTFFTIYDPQIAAAIQAEDFTTDEEEEDTRIFSVDDNETVLTFNEYHGRVNIAYSFILELKRFLKDRDSYNYEFEMLSPLLSLEMLLMFPQPDTSRIPLVKQHMNKLSSKSTVPKEFFELLSGSYQAYSRIEEANPRMVRKLFSTLERSMKDTSRSFWKQVTAKLNHDEHDKVESLIAIMWTHLRAIQTQAQHREQQAAQTGRASSQSHAITVRLEHIFWIQGRSYHERDEYQTPIQFWSAFAAIANKQVRSKEDSLDLFNELDNLLNQTQVLSDEQQQETLVVNHADQYSLIQRLLSYGLEARDDTIYDTVENYLKVLETLLDEIDEAEMHDSFDLDQEKKVVDDIRKHMKNPISVDN